MHSHEYGAFIAFMQVVFLVHLSEWCTCMSVRAFSARAQVLCFKCACMTVILLMHLHECGAYGAPAF